MTFVVSMIILLLNFVWLYIDEFVGKGLEGVILLELFSYLTVRLVPTALTLGILIASVMSFGHLAEHSELAAMKSSGLSLLRIFKPLLILLLVIISSSVYLSSEVIPVTNLKFRTLLENIKNKKPEVLIPEGQFYGGLSGYTVYIDKRDKESNVLNGIMIYDPSTRDEYQKLILADKGTMEVFTANSQLKFTLIKGSSYAELSPKSGSPKASGFRRDYFDRQEVIINLPDSELERRNSSSLASLYTMLNNRQLRDTILALKDERQWEGKKFANRFLIHLGMGSTPQSYVSDKKHSTAISRNITQSELQYSVNLARSQKEQIRMFSEEQSHRQKWINNFMIERNNRLALACTCLVFLLIGAPLGAKFKKGGLGSPVIISTIAYIIYHILNIAGIKYAKADLVQVAIGVWGPLLVLMIIGLTLTILSSNDRLESVTNSIGSYLKKLISFAK